MSACGHYRQSTDSGVKLPCARPGCSNGHRDDTCQTYTKYLHPLGYSATTAAPDYGVKLERWTRVQSGLSWVWERQR